MNSKELQDYYDGKQKELKVYLEAELKKFKDANDKYLSAIVAKACEHAKNLLESSNQKAFERFNQSQLDIERKIEQSYPSGLLENVIKSAQSDLEGSLKFNKTLFENSVAYYKNQLNG